MRKLLISIILLIIVLSANSQNLSGLVVIIDSGHGGKDLGCVVKNSQFIENAYCYDVALRLEKILKDSGIIVFKTTKDSKRRINNTILGNIPSLSHAVFSINGKMVKNGKGLYKRTDFCNLKFQKYHDHEIVFISIHFDVTSSDFLGARIIKEKGNYKSSLFSDILKEELQKKNLLSNSFFPVFENGDPLIYKRHLHILSGKNKISPKVLIELGNTQNQEDLLRIKNPNIREEYARVMFNALKKYAQKTN
jgi:N-acetylmuramoyl-L-alanine amidase